MKHTASIISRYTADISGVCSALYELGGMTVMHDAGGYGSLYATHDEPRWYDQDSLIFVSGLTETQAILGDDQKFLEDTIQAAQRLKPRFIALTGSPIPMVIGTDFPALALEVAQATDIPTFGFNTDGMHPYTTGIDQALTAIATRFCTEALPKTPNLTVNLLGVTPLDFSVNGTVSALTESLAAHGITVHSNWAMYNDLDALKKASQAHVNLVVTTGGLGVAKLLQQRFKMPYVVGMPYGPALMAQAVTAIQTADQTGVNQSILNCTKGADTYFIGETVTTMSLATAYQQATGQGSRVICPVDAQSGLLTENELTAHDEDDIRDCLKTATTIVADPLYQPICPASARFVPLPHEAFSGRIYHDTMPNLVTDFAPFLQSLV
ncbi:nitrogenase component 1 [Agrilactobacillus yilanensis]|uniref:Nitrogenase component 1 n=1 Tax=Agrilactobacillus yilanensis TaxID=2485997 RepID=A0ABW4J3U0_9LACO|nr:nitrogenase component 1 [Agrilactobacillus yilanensis]